MAAAMGPLSDEKAGRMMIALHTGATLRTFGVKAHRLSHTSQANRLKCPVSPWGAVSLARRGTSGD